MRVAGLAFVCLVAGSLAATPARADEVPLPSGATLRGTVEADAIREIPELKGALINRNRDESVRGVHVLDQTYETAAGYRDTARFFDRAFEDTTLIEREQAATTTGWLVSLDDGTIASVTLRNTHPTTIEIQRVAPPAVTAP